MGDQTFARLIRKRRDALGLSQARLGELVGRSATTIRNWERAQASPSERSDVVALAAVLGLNEVEVLEQAGFEPAVPGDHPTMEQAYASLTAETAAVVPEPVIDPEPVVDPEPEVGAPIESSSPPLRVPPPPVVESLATPIPAESAPVESQVEVSSSEEGPTDADPDDEPAPRRTRRAAPPTVLEAAPPGEPSYIEDADERERYRVRAIATAALVVAIFIILLWSFDRASAALGGLWDVLIDSLAL